MIKIDYANRKDNPQSLLKKLLFNKITFLHIIIINLPTNSLI